MSFYVGAPSLASSFLFGSDGNSLLDPGVAVEQREHEASHVSSSHCAAWRLTIVVRHKVSLMGQKLLSCGRKVLEARWTHHSPVDVLRLLQKLLHLIHVAEDTSD